MTDERKQAQDVYIRVCKDSGFQLDWASAVHIAARVLGISSMELWVRMEIPMTTLDEIATGKHPVCR